MKAVTKEAILEAIDKVEQQGFLLRCGYRNINDCRCVVGFMMDDEEIKLVSDRKRNHLTICRLAEEVIDLDEESLMHLSTLQSLNDRCETLEEFLQKSKEYVREI